MQYGVSHVHYPVASQEAVRPSLTGGDKNRPAAAVRVRGRSSGGDHGGEPTLAEDLPEILQYCVQLRLKVFLATNLYRTEHSLMRRILELLSETKHTVMASYDSVLPDEMEAIRGD